MTSPDGFFCLQILPKFNFGRDCAPDPAGGAYSAPPAPSWWGGGWLPPPQEPLLGLRPRSSGLTLRPFGPCTILFFCEHEVATLFLSCLLHFDCCNKLHLVFGKEFCYSYEVEVCIVTAVSFSHGRCMSVNCQCRI